MFPARYKDQGAELLCSDSIVPCLPSTRIAGPILNYAGSFQTIQQITPVMPLMRTSRRVLIQHFTTEVRVIYMKAKIKSTRSFLLLSCRVKIFVLIQVPEKGKLLQVFKSRLTINLLKFIFLRDSVIESIIPWPSSESNHQRTPGFWYMLSHLLFAWQIYNGVYCWI